MHQGKKIKETKGNARRITNIENELQLELLSLEEERIKEALKNNDIITEERERLKERLIDIEKDKAREEINIAKETEKQKREKLEDNIASSIPNIKSGY